MSTAILEPTKVMAKKPTKTPARERKTPHGVQNQLASRKAAPKEGDIVAHFLPISGQDLAETIKDISKKLKPAKSTPAKPAKADKSVNKARRVFKKAGCPDPTDVEVELYLRTLAEIKKKSSRTLAKEIREKTKARK